MANILASKIEQQVPLKLSEQKLYNFDAEQFVKMIDSYQKMLECLNQTKNHLSASLHF